MLYGAIYGFVMKYFKKLNFSQPDLYTEYLRLLDEGIIDWNGDTQIALVSVPEKPDDIYLGTKSLWYDWSKMTREVAENGNEKTVVPPHENPLDEDDFTYFVDRFRGTLFEDVYNELSEVYELGRIRLMKNRHGNCMSWHYDPSERIHYPLKTQLGCKMVIQDEVMELPKHEWWWTNTTVRHTAFNGSGEDRIHLVFVILGEKNNEHSSA